MQKTNNSNTRLGNVEQKNIHFAAQEAVVERWCEQGSMFPHFLKNTNWLLCLQLGCFSGLMQLLGLERVLLIISRASSLCWLAAEETITTPHFTFWGCPRSPTNRRSWEVTQKQIITFIPPLKKKEKKIFKAVQQWGKVLEPGTETAFRVRAPCLFSVNYQGPSEEM